VEASTVQLDKQ